MASTFNWKRGQECELCGDKAGPFRETFYGMTICVDSESCTNSRIRQGLVIRKDDK